ncbi:hypothetical protein D3C78_837430 [compost metagenome]
MDSSAPRSPGSPALSFTTIAGKPAPTRDRAHAETVGASLLAMDSNAPRLSSSPALSLTTIAAMRRPDKPAPTRDRAHAVIGFYKNATAAHRRLGLGESIQLHGRVPTLESQKKRATCRSPVFLYPKLSIQPIKCSPSAMASAIHALVKSRTLGERKGF